MKSTYKIAIALALAYVSGTPVVTVLLLYVDGSNPALFDCAAYWLRRTLPALHIVVQRCLVPACKFLSRYADRYLRYAGYESAGDVLESAPIVHVACFEVVTFTSDLVAFYKRRSSTPKPAGAARLCCNGDHGNMEETLIIVREHLQKITGAVITAIFLSALLTYAQQTLMPSSYPASAASASAASACPSACTSVCTPASTPASTPVGHDYAAYPEYPESDFDDMFGSPRAYHRRPPPPPSQPQQPQQPQQPPQPADPEAVVVVYRPVPPPPHFVPDPGMTLAEAQKAMRAAKEACAQQSAQAFVAAVRKRIQQDNHDADSGFTGGVHTDPDRAAEAAIGMALFGLAD